MPGRAHLHTDAYTMSPQKYAALCQGSLQFHSTQQNVFLNISLMVDMYTHTHTHALSLSGERSVHYQQVLSPGSPLPAGVYVQGSKYVHVRVHTHRQ